MQLLRRCLSWSYPLALLLAPLPALAAPSARLVYVREPGAEVCADEPGLRRAVAARLGYDPFFPWAKVLVVVGVRKDGGAYRAEVTLVDDTGVSRGKREVTSQGDDCAPLVGALALTISLALNPLSLSSSGPPPTEPPPPVIEAPPPPAPLVAVAAPSVAAPIVVAPAPPPEPSWRGWAGILASGSYGVLPTVGIGGGFRGRIERGRWSLAVEASADGPTSAPVPAGGKVQVWVAQAALMGCARVAFVVGCGLVEGGPLVGRGAGLAVDRTQVEAYGGVGPRLGVEWLLGTRFLLEGFAQLAMALPPHALQVDGTTVYRQPDAAVTLGAALSARIF